MCPTKCLPVLYHQSDTILQGLHIPPMAFTSGHDWESNLLASDERAGTLLSTAASLSNKQVQVAAWLESWFSHLGVAGLVMKTCDIHWGNKQPL